MRFLYAVSSAFLLMLFMDFLEEVTGSALSDTIWLNRQQAIDAWNKRKM